MHPHQYALAAGILWLVTLIVLPCLFAKARYRAYERGHADGKLSHQHTLKLQLQEAKRAQESLRAELEDAQRNCAQQATIQELEASLEYLRNDHRHLAEHAKRLKETNALQETHHRSLLEIAETLRIAAETWSAFKTGKKLERDARRLRDETLAIAHLLKPAEQEAAA